MLRHLPKFTFTGLTIIMSNPSRYDDKELLSGVPGWIFNKECLQPEINRWQCDIRLIDDKSPLLPNTKVILLLGDKAHRLYTGANTSVDENRGSPIVVGGIPTVSSFSAIDAVDFKDYEKDKNPNYQSVEEFMSDEIAAGELVSAKGRNKTARVNYRWWLRQDTKKALRILNNNGVIPREIYDEPNYHLTPDSESIIQILTNIKGDFLHIDIETDFQTLDIRCIGFSFESRPRDVYIFPVLDIDYKPAYHDLHRIFQALAIAFRDNTTVAHNGAVFDFFVLAYKYNIPIGRRCYDSLVAQQRIFPNLEKSLGHCISYYTYLGYHKDQGNHGYRSREQAEQLMLYCGKDVYGMMLVKKAQERLMEKDEGLKSSIMWSSRAIYSYLIQTYLGQKYDKVELKKIIDYNDAMMTEFLRWMRILTGTKDLEPLISNKKCVEYFHEELGYKVVKRSPGTARPSLDGESLYKLKLNHKDNIVIDILLKYRSLQKETGTLNFKPWVS